MNVTGGFETRQSLEWPEQIPQKERSKLACGKGSFLYLRRGDRRIALHMRPIRITGNVLIIPLKGQLELGVGGRSRIVETNTPVFLTDTEQYVSEWPVPRSGECQSLWFFFPDSVLAMASPGSSHFLGRFHMYATHPVATSVIPLVKMFLAPGLLREENRQYSLKHLLTAALNSLKPAFLKLYLKRVVIPRVRIELFLDRLILRPQREHTRLLAGYPGGLNALRRRLRALGMPGASEIVTARRRALYQEWKARGATDKEILEAFHLKEFGKILEPDPSEERNRRNMDELSRLLGSLIVPGKSGNESEGASSSKRQYVFGSFYTTPLTREDIASIPNLPSEYVAMFDKKPTSEDSPQEEIDFKDTGLTRILPPSLLNKIPGLEDWEQLLKVA